MNEFTTSGGDCGRIPYRQIRARYTENTIRVYQAFSNAIADAALAAGTFRPPFKLDRMTWIKPSFLWMMYRSGWGYKEPAQARILAVDITQAGFDWALRHGILSKPDAAMQPAEWLARKRLSSVRIQWDPERNLKLAPLGYRSIQIGLAGYAVRMYVDTWIRGITEVTALSHEICALVREQQLEQAQALLPREVPYRPSVGSLPGIGLDDVPEDSDHTSD